MTPRAISRPGRTADPLLRLRRRRRGVGGAARVSTLLTLLLGTVALTPTAVAAHGHSKQPGPAHLIAYVRPGKMVALRDRPFGRVLAQVGSRTPFGSPRAFAVVEKAHRGRWLGITDPAVGGNRLVWADARARSLHYAETSLELDVDLSNRTLVVLRDGSVLRRLRVGIGRPGSSTPLGRFAVTDKLDGRLYAPAYGCCILALSAMQPRLPAGWLGGDRIAIHGTSSPSDLGAAVSAGCLHAGDYDLRFLMRTVPLGTPVVIRP